jgi:thiol:disulfide interchange protein
MDTFRKILAIPMGLVALALVWLAWRLGGTMFAVDAAIVSIAVVVALVAWNKGRNAGLGMALVAAAAATGMLLRTYDPPASSSEDGVLAAVSFSDTALAEARAANKPVFLWFTADWCLTCKVNEGVAIEREATKAAFAKAGVVAMRGDWTRRDPAITRFLTAHGAAGVPLYLWYAPGKDGEVLPQVLTPDMLSDLAKQS